MITTDNKTIKSKVWTQIEHDLGQGVNVLTLGCQQIADYSQSVTNVLMLKYQTYYRQGTVERYIREWKEWKRKQPTNDVPF